jgi:hypothetical protein
MPRIYLFRKGSANHPARIVAISFNLLRGSFYATSGIL